MVQHFLLTALLAREAGEPRAVDTSVLAVVQVERLTVARTLIERELLLLV